MALADLPVTSPKILTVVRRAVAEAIVYSTLVLGAPRSGKMWAVRPQIKEWADQYRGAFVAYLPQPMENAKLLVQQAHADGHGARIDYDSLDDPNHCLKFLSFPKSRHPDLYQRATENANNRDNLIELLGRNRREEIDKQVTVIELATHGIDLCLEAEMDVTFEHLLAVGKAGHPKFHALLDNCPNEELVWYWRTFPKGGAAARKELASLWRLTEQKFGDPRILTRQGDRRLLLDKLRAGGLIHLEGSESRKATKTHMGLAGMATKQAIRTHFAQTGEMLPTLELSDEVQGFDLFTKYESMCQREMKKMGLFSIVISHGPHLLADPDENSEALQNFDAVLSRVIKDWPTALYIGHLCAGGAFNPFLEHHRNRRIVQRHDGFISVPTMSTTKSKGLSGDRETESEGTNNGTRLVPQYRFDREETVDYVKLDEQGKYVASCIMGLGDRECLTRRLNTVQWEIIPEMEHPWILPEIGEVKMTELLKEIHQRPEYSHPSIGERVVMSSRLISDSIQAQSTNATNGGNGSGSKKSHSNPVQALLEVLRPTGSKRDAH